MASGKTERKARREAPEQLRGLLQDSERIANNEEKAYGTGTTGKGPQNVQWLDWPTILAVVVGLPLLLAAVVVGLFGTFTVEHVHYPPPPPTGLDTPPPEPNAPPAPPNAAVARRRRRRGHAAVAVGAAGVIVSPSPTPPPFPPSPPVSPPPRPHRRRRCSRPTGFCSTWRWWCRRSSICRRARRAGRGGAEHAAAAVQ